MEGHIEDNLSCRSQFEHQARLEHTGHKPVTERDIDYYRVGEYRELFDACKEHMAKHARPIEGNVVVMVTHPFYLFLSHMNYVSSLELQTEADEYWNRLMNVFEGGLCAYGVGIVAFETIHHYAAATSLLLENGQIDRVFFTQFDKGYLAEQDGFGELKDKQFYIGGSYNGHCYRGSCEEVYKMASSDDKIWAIRDLVIDHPAEFDSVIDPKENMVIWK